MNDLNIPQLDSGMQTNENENDCPNDKPECLQFWSWCDCDVVEVSPVSYDFQYEVM